MSFTEKYKRLAEFLMEEGKTVVEPPHQMTHLRTRPEWTSIELTNIDIEYEIPDMILPLMEEVQPNLPWAETHFQERVSGIPHNPPPSHSQWPYARSDNEKHRKDGKFSHTYPERMWPETAGMNKEFGYGIRYPIGDLDDLVALLAGHAYTRQAYLPIWFPEDLTAANFGERVPCTLGYHFLLREGKLNMTYLIRSCDLVRFLRDDVYMACRLCQWVLDAVKQKDGEKGPPFEDSEWYGVKPGTLTMHIVSLHCFEGDLPMLRRQYATSRA